MKEMTRYCLILLMLLAFSSCATQQKTGTAVGSGVGAAVGAGLGQAIGGDTEATLLGAGIGAVVGGLTGNQIGAYMDRQEDALRDAAAASDATSVRRSQDVLTAIFKGDVFFDFDSAVLKPGAYTELNRIAGILRQYPQTRITVAGHTDNKGSEAYNLKLSQRRANAVRNALAQRGVDARRIRTVGYGESQPISSIDAMNRRVEIIITPIQKKGHSRNRQSRQRPARQRY